MLQRLRDLCVIDADNKVVPREQRADLREVRKAAIEAERARVDEMLKAQGIVRRPIDTETV